MRSFFDFFIGFEVGAHILPKLPKVFKGIAKGFALILSIVIWCTLSSGSSVFDWSLGAGIKALNIIFCILVWVLMVGVFVLKIITGKDFYKLYYWAFFALSIAIAVANVGEGGVGLHIWGAFLGLFLMPFPKFIYILADAVANKVAKLSR